jgi:hypothetical protein
VIQPVGIDLYPGDGPKDLDAYVAAGAPWHFAIFKIAQGLDYQYATWAERCRSHLVTSERYGVDLFDGFYHYLTFHQDGRAQCDWAMLHLSHIGGEMRGTMPLMVDVERGGQRIQSPSKAQVEDRVRSFAARYLELTGRTATLYGGELLRSVGVTDLLGCGRSAVALYSPRLGRANEGTEEFLHDTGTDLQHLMLWQYTSADAASTPPAGYPTEAPGCGRVDILALTLSGGLSALRSLMRT